MSRMSELSQVLDELISCGEGMIKAAGELKELFSEPSEDKTPAVPYGTGTNPGKTEPAAKPETKTASGTAETETGNEKASESDAGQNAKLPEPQPRTWSFEEVRKACAAKSHAGFTSQVRDLIHKYGSDRLSGIKTEDYPSLMQDLEVIG